MLLTKLDEGDNEKMDSIPVVSEYMDISFRRYIKISTMQESGVLHWSCAKSWVNVHSPLPNGDGCKTSDKCIGHNIASDKYRSLIGDLCNT